MREEILKNVVSVLCDDFVDAIVTGVKENEDEFPFTIACTNFICELKEKGIKVNLRIFADSSDIFDRMYKELSTYLAR